ncbi:DNA alkylation repair protein [Yoonia sp. F2084L]|uniref:DNA alkylation repair protein n=1 Tax=Yoonia sp. F2084L TaxID=2926419 RepID=UPI001FF3EDD2|nr:DNA alkylation repair protein [Yoonia sp. F2084L]MCK0095212.1 DNA alkylation repair protein [Yoonia sp. F2084L]
MKAEQVISWLQDNSSAETKAGLLRYGIPNERAFGVRMGDMKRYAKTLDRDHDLALQLWKDGRYEARTMAVFLAELDKLTSKQADQWCSDFDNWAICDTACFDLFDRTDFAWDKVHQWAPNSEEFVRRASFALVWALAFHDKSASNATFEATFPLMRAAAIDERPLVKKAIDMALRAAGKRNYALNRTAVQFATDLKDMDDKTANWIGRQALRKLADEALLAKLKANMS